MRWCQTEELKMANEFKYCLVQFFAWQADKRKQKQFLKCKECPFRERCKNHGEQNEQISEFKSIKQ